MMLTYSTADQFCDGMTWRDWIELGNRGPCPYHTKTLRNYNKKEAYAIAKKKNLKAFVCELSGKWHLASGGFSESDFAGGPDNE